MKALLKEVNSSKAELIEGEGLYLPQSKIMIGGEFIHDVNGEDVRRDKNIVVDHTIICKSKLRLEKSISCGHDL